MTDLTVSHRKKRYDWEAPDRRQPRSAMMLDACLINGFALKAIDTPADGTPYDHFGHVISTQGDYRWR